MKNETKELIATMLLNGIIWTTGGVVATQAIKTTGRGEWGWIMLIPALSSFSYHRNSTTEDE